MGKYRRHARFQILSMIALSGAACAASSQGFERTALDEYVAAPDPNYAYTIVTDEQLDGFRHVVVDMVSQQWLTEKEVERLLKVAKQGRHGQRDHLMVLMAFRHGLLVSEFCDLQWTDIEFRRGTIHVRRLK